MLSSLLAMQSGSLLRQRVISFVSSLPCSVSIHQHEKLFIASCQVEILTAIVAGWVFAMKALQFGNS